ncbi:MAG: hypothetical protein FWB71_01260 [Defluviitaleaceae bacterium]|nr:hypothetical protein [Defluviitaleaceae bacterium]
MANERMQVLKMVEDGKITVDEATKLLESLKVNGVDTKTFEERFSNFTHGFGEFAKEMSCKLGAAYKEMEPKVKDFTKKMVAKTADIADSISQNLHEKMEKMKAEDCECECDCPEGECDCDCEPTCECPEGECRCN